MNLRDVVLIVMAPLALTLGALVGSIRMRMDRRADLGLLPPPARHAVVFTALFLALVSTHELLSWWMLPNTGGSDWRAKYNGSALVMRVVFAAVAYPVAEKLFFRGFLLALFNRKAGSVVAVFLTAVLFTSMHGLQGPWLGGCRFSPTDSTSHTHASAAARCTFPWRFTLLGIAWPCCNASGDPHV